MTMESTSEDAGKLGSTAVEVSRLVSKPLKSVWMSLMTIKGAEALLGTGGQIPDKGHSWKSTGGAHGVIRSFHPMEQIRFTWHDGEEAPATLVDLRFETENDGTKISVLHTNISADANLEEIKKRWEAALERLAQAQD